MFKENTRNLHTRTHTHTHRKFERGKGESKDEILVVYQKPIKTERMANTHIRTLMPMPQSHSEKIYIQTHSPRTHSTNTFRTSSSSFCQIYASRFCTSNVILFVLLSMLLLLLRLALTISFLAFTK